MNVPRKLDTKQVEDNEKYHVHLDGYDDKYDVHLDGYDGIYVPGSRAPSPPPHPQGEGCSSWGFMGGEAGGKMGQGVAPRGGKGRKLGQLSHVERSSGQVGPSWCQDLVGPSWGQIGTRLGQLSPA